MDVQQIASLASAFGGGAVLLVLVTGLKDWWTGAAGRERDRNTDLATQRRNAIEESMQAEKDRDTEARKRRESEEHVSILRRQLRENGIVPRERTEKTLQEDKDG